MKKIVFCSLLLLLLGNFSCRKEDQTPGFDMFYQQEFTIPAGISVFQVHHFQMRNIASRYEQYLSQQGKTDADVTSILTSKAVLNGIFGDANLNFVDQVSLRIYDESNENDYIEIAYRQPVPLEPGNMLPLIPSLADSKRLLTSSRFAMDVVFWLRTTTVVETELRLDLQMKATY